MKLLLFQVLLFLAISNNHFLVIQADESIASASEVDVAATEVKVSQEGETATIEDKKEGETIEKTEEPKAKKESVTKEGK